MAVLGKHAPSYLPHSHSFFSEGKPLLMDVNLNMPPHGARREDLQIMAQAGQIGEDQLEGPKENMICSSVLVPLGV